MRKRISKEKDIKPGGTGNHNKKEGEKVVKTRDLLLSRTECLRQGLRFQSDKIESIIKGTSLQSIRFQQIQKNCSFQEFLKKYYPFHHIKLLFTDLIKRNALVGDITFMDFKLKNFVIMNNYTYQLRRIKFGKERGDQNLTGSRSSTKEGKHFKEMEIEVKKITKRQGSRKGNHNVSVSFTNLLIRNIEKMLKSYREPGVTIPTQMDFKPILTAKIMQVHDFSHLNHERLHTSPEPQGFDAYGLEQFKQNSTRKLEQISQMSCINKVIARSKLNKEKSQDTLRYQTEYDTQRIVSKRSKSKKNVIGMKKSMGKVKSTSKCKSPFSKPVQQRTKK